MYDTYMYRTYISLSIYIIIYISKSVILDFGCLSNIVNGKCKYVQTGIFKSLFSLPLEPQSDLAINVLRIQLERKERVCTYVVISAKMCTKILTLLVLIILSTYTLQQGL